MPKFGVFEKFYDILDIAFEKSITECKTAKEQLFRNLEKDVCPFPRKRSHTEKKKRFLPHLQVSMYNALGMHVLRGTQDLMNEGAGVTFWISAFFDDAIEKFASSHSEEERKRTWEGRGQLSGRLRGPAMQKDSNEIKNKGFR